MYVQGEGDTCKIAKRYVVYLGILPILGKKEYREDAQQQTSRNGGRFAGKIWREICGKNMVGRLEVNPNTAVNDAEQ